MENAFLQAAQAMADDARQVRRDLHRHPELGFQEYRTAGIIAAELAKLNIETMSGIAQTGVVGLIEGARPGPVVLLRFDMDALPIQEENQVEYVSTRPGVMHACGHDGHVAIGLTVARLLAGARPDLAGTIKLVFQPAEEGLGGAERMLAEGVLENPRPDYALALHLWNDREVGWAGIVPGALMAGADKFQVRISGRGGHGGLPEQSIDPVVAAAQLVSGIQTIVSRNLSPLEAGVISVTQLTAGDTFNVIPAWAEIKGTIRTFDPPVRQRILERLQALVEHVPAAFGCTSALEVRQVTPAVVNDARVTAVVEQAARDSGAGFQIESDYHTTVSEDMAYLLERVPGCYFFVGSANAQAGLNFGHHHPRFDFDERALPLAAGLMASAAAALAGYHRG
ncbi:MAG: amidohydrolase [Chloroflexi bacterium]|nr:amidohydrolase [Chloroflexota bacterium]